MRPSTMPSRYLFYLWNIYTKKRLTLSFRSCFCSFITQTEYRQIMMLGITIVAFCALCSSVSAVDMSSVQPYNLTAAVMFAQEDLNSDGVMTVAEIDSIFAMYDQNGDGKESRNEYTTMLCAFDPDMYMLSHYLYDDYDVNGDHQLEISDYEGFHGKMDANNDGDVTEAEFVTYWIALFENIETQAAAHPHGNSHEHGHCTAH